MAHRDIIVIGASAGGIKAVSDVLSKLPMEFPVTLLVVVHLSPESPSMLPHIFSRAGPLPAINPSDLEPIEPGRIYVAPPDRHMLVVDGHIKIVRGPKENRHRPAVDPLFRTAARVYGPRVVGIVLTGLLDDGTAGLQAIKQRGGVTVVQDPNDAEFPSMPRNAMTYVKIDHVLPLAEIPDLLKRLAPQKVDEKKAPPVSEKLETESRYAEADMSAMENEEKLGKPSVLTCPECQGALWEIEEEKLVRFRCRVGHSYSSESLMVEQNDAVERALWAAMRALKENRSLANRMAEEARGRRQTSIAKLHEERAREAAESEKVLRDLIFKNGDTAKLK